MSDEDKNDWLKPLLKALLIMVVVFVVMVVVGFGLLVGFCALGGKR